MEKAERYRSYFGREGGVTLSGGEPLMQKEFSAEIFRLCHEKALNTCLDTSGCLDPSLCADVLRHTDRVLLDIKYTQDAAYRQFVGCELAVPLRFLAYLNAQKIPTTLRQVIIPSLNNTRENVLALLCIAKAHACVDKIELLPFKKICQTKYDSMGIAFPFAHLPTPTKEQMDALRVLLGSYGG